MKIYSGIMSLLAGSALFAGVAVAGGTQVEPAKALDMLNNQSGQFQKQVVKITDNIYTAVGYHGSNTSMIIGDDGVIIVDTLRGNVSAAQAHMALRKYSDKPVKAILLTHSHPDHIGGVKVFSEDQKVPVYASEHFGVAEHGLNKDVAPIKRARNIRQFGRKLPPKDITNRGVAPGVTPKEKRSKLPKANVIIPDEGLNVTIAGVDIEFYYAPGETDDAVFVWLPKQKVLFSGDNFYRSFPNLYAIRGTTYRNVLNWSDSVGNMASFKPEILVPGHTVPIFGQKEATTALQDYSDAIRSVYDQTIKGMNQGKGINQIAHEVQLPENLRGKPYLTEFYGNVRHAVRAIFVGLIGWYDGNPTNLNPMAPKEEAQRVAKLAGGTKNLVKQMKKALKDEDYQWALELADHLKWLEGGDKMLELARNAKIEALRGLAAQEYNAPNRNYYLSYANELAKGKLKDVWF